VTVIAPKRLLLTHEQADQPWNHHSDWSQRGEPALLIRATPYGPLTLSQIAAYPSRLLIVHPDDQLDPKRQLLATFRELFASTPLLVLEDAQQCQLLLSDQPSQAACWNEVQELLTNPRRELSAGHLLIGRSRAFRQVLQAVDQLSDQSTPLLLQGEPGSGKAQLALAIHQRSQRRELSCWSIDCNQLSQEACRLALFGPAEFVADSAADSQQHSGLLNHPGVGTIIFHELAHLPPAVQLQLLRWLQQPRRDNLHRPHLVFTTSHDLGRLVADHRMRADLFFELSSHLIGLPPLRHRRGDVGLLADHFTQCLAPALRICQRPSIRLTEPQRELLDNYDWPGNITQLRRLVVSHYLRPQQTTTKGDHTTEHPTAANQLTADQSSADQLQELLLELVPDSHSGLLEQSGQTASLTTRTPDEKTTDPAQASGEPTREDEDQPDGATPRIWSLFIDKMVSDSSTNLYARAIEQFERGLFTEILNRTGGNVGEAARLLGITRVSLRKKLQHFSIEPNYFGKL